MGIRRTEGREIFCKVVPTHLSINLLRSHLLHIYSCSKHKTSPATGIPQECWPFWNLPFSYKWYWMSLSLEARTVLSTTACQTLHHPCSKGLLKHHLPDAVQWNETLLSHRKEWNNAICSNMDGPKDYHTKWIKSERERQISYDIT